MRNGTNEHKLLSEKEPDDRNLILGAGTKDDDWWLITLGWVITVSRGVTGSKAVL